MASYPRPYDGGVGPPGSSALVPPAVARVRGDSQWEPRGKGRARTESPASSSAPSQSSLASAQAVAPASSSTRASPSPGPAPAATTTVSSTTRRLGALGIPLSGSDDEEDLDFSGSTRRSTNSLDGNPPASPHVPFLEPPEATYSRGGSTRSGPSTRSGETDGPAFVSEQSFRDIVDDLTLQNQRLKARLKRFESARVPTNLRNERLFEVRFFDGLPKQSRREIEGFLTDFVQTISNTASSGDLASSSSRRHVTGQSSNQDKTESTSSLGATLRSLRSSERDALATMQSGTAAAGPATRSASGSGSGSGSGKRVKSRSRPKEPALPPLIEPLGASSTPVPPDPPALLRRPTDVFPPERDVLAAPSFSGIEPRSVMGTGSGMRISDPTSKKRKRSPNSPEAATSPERPARVRRTASHDSSVTSGSGTDDPERLEHLIVDMLERLFLESLPSDAPDGALALSSNSLRSEPHPLPPQSSTNTQYLRAMLDADETQSHGGWLYLNLVSTMAALHRLNVSIATVRHALRTKSKLIEVSDEGNKIRWKGPRTRPVKRPSDAAQAAFGGMGDMEDNSIEATRMEGVEQAQRERDADRRREAGRSSASSSTSEGEPESMFDERPGNSVGLANGSGTGAQPSKDSTAPTSQYPSAGSGSGPSKNGSSSQGDKRLFSGREQVDAAQPAAASAMPRTAAPHTSSALRYPLEEAEPLADPAAGDVGGEGDSVGVLGGLAPAATAPRRLLYTPLFARRGDSASEPESTSEDGSVASQEAVGEGVAVKRRKDYDGGVVFFANPLFYSDLAGDAGARLQIRKDLEEAPTSPHEVLGETSSVGADWLSQSLPVSGSGEATSRTRSSAASHSDSGATASESAHSGSDVRMPEVDVSASAPVPLPAIDVALGWDGIEDVSVAPSYPPPPAANEYDAFISVPYPNLQLSGTSDVTAADHFTTHVKHLHPSLPSSLDLASLPKRIRPSFASCLPAPLSSHPQSPAVVQARCLATHTLHHHPSVCVRFPRLRLRMSSHASDSDSDDDASRKAAGSSSPTSSQLRRLPNFGGSVSGADYLMSLSLPLNHWAPDAKRHTSSDERASDARRTGTGTSHSLITMD
ncbi:uncharacterized protein JCM10292_002353 [Rhodotorula paludigena]|uniref:uncharacterized protein n=1 Tax=Rhodotorula paludigena TaxID=86838 RepID=UPI00317B75E9